MTNQIIPSDSLVCVCLVVNKLIDELLEEIAEQIRGAGLDPLPIPDIQLPFSMDNVLL